jgi:alkanesulfonate monooxygenase SsuD/methylene tetrahydromethanopterin reductase-like flavin-dependent oxidoreductase (luciferase family)
MQAATAGSEGSGVKFGIFDHMEQAAAPPGARLGEQLGLLYEDRLRMLELADEAGFARYHKAEHHFTVLDSAPSSAVFLAAASQRTKRIRLGSLVSLLPFYHPLRLIEEICALDHLTAGRLDVGVGKGISPVEHRLWGNPPEEAMARTLETLAIVQAGLTSERLTHAGAAYGFDDVPLTMSPLQKPHPPFWYPGNVEFAGAHRLNTVVGGPPAAVKAHVARYRELVAQSSSDWNPGVRDPIIGATRHIYIAANRDEAVDRARQAWRRYHENLTSLWRAHGIAPSGAGPTLGGDFDRALSLDLVLAGTPDDALAHVNALRDGARLDYFVGAFAWGDLSHAETVASLTLFADAVVRPLTR